MISPSEAPIVSRPTILVVEDHDQLRDLITRVLERSGFRALACPNGARALDRLTQGEYVDVVVSDVAMPELDGIALARQLRAKYPHVKIILMSGYGEEDETLGDAACWVDHVLPKPFSPPALFDALRSLTRKIA